MSGADNKTRRVDLDPQLKGLTDILVAENGGLTVVGVLTADSIESGNIHSTGSVDIDVDLNVDGAAQIDGALTAGTNAATAHVLTGDLNITDDLDVDGDGNIDGALQVDGAITAGADAATAHKLTGDLNVTDDVDVDGDLNVDGSQQLDGTITIGGTGNTIPMVTVDSAALAVSQIQTIAHNLGAKPNRWQISLLCISAEANFAVNEEITFPNGYNGGSNNSIWQVSFDATNITTITGSAVIVVRDKTTGAVTGITMNKWKIRVRYGL